MRAFLAVFPPPEVQQAVHRQLAALRGGREPIAWVRRENLHLTLRFLGEVDEGTCAAAAAAARETAARHGAFEVVLGAPGAFPDARHARVLWLGLAGGALESRAIAASLEEALVARGFAPAEPPFTPHLTVGRPRARVDWTPRFAALPPLQAAFRVHELVLVESVLAPGGSRYAVRERFPLRSA